MPLPLILDVPGDPRGWDSFSFAHQLDHREIIQAVKKQHNISLPDLDLWPIDPQDRQAWEIFLQLHQQAHDDFNGLLGTPGSDLTGADPEQPDTVRSWLHVNYNDHLNARTALRI